MTDVDLLTLLVLAGAIVIAFFGSAAIVHAWMDRRYSLGVLATAGATVAGAVGIVLVMQTLPPSISRCVAVFAVIAGSSVLALLVMLAGER